MENYNLSCVSFFGDLQNRAGRHVFQDSFNDAADLLDQNGNLAFFAELAGTN
jgi:hypothetical protein